jgi:putative ABC transport system substrate-binding protein
MKALLTAMLTLAPLVSTAQAPGKPHRIGYLVTGSAVSFPFSVEPFKRGMSELGYREGTDFVLDIRTADGKNERLPALAADLVRLKVDVIVASTTPATQAAMRATTTIPIVIANAADPVQSGLVKSLARPGANVTGLSNLVADLGQKQLEMLREVVPGVSRVAVLINPGNESNRLIAGHVELAAKRFGVSVVRVEAKDSAGLENAFAVVAAERAQALIVALEGFFVQQRQQIAELSLKHRVPTMFSGSGHVEAGGLMSYGPDIADNFRRAAGYVDRIFKGAKAGDLPIEQASKFEVLVNVKTARMLGLTIPREVLFRADRVIE